MIGALEYLLGSFLGAFIGAFLGEVFKTWRRSRR